MLYHLFNYLDKAYNLPGVGVFQYISFRAGAAALVSLLIAMGIILSVSRNEMEGNLPKENSLPKPKPVAENVMVNA